MRALWTNSLFTSLAYMSEPFWGLPSSEWSTAALLAEAGVSRNTINARLGTREVAQRRYQAAEKRRERQKRG